MRDFATTLMELLEAEYDYTREESERLVKKHTNIVMQGIMSGLSYMNLRATATAIELAESPEPVVEG